MEESGKQKPGAKTSGAQIQDNLKLMFKAGAKKRVS